MSKARGDTVRQQHAAVIGREGAVRAVADTLRATGETAGVLLVTAGAGMGKTTVVELAQQAALRAAPRWCGSAGQKMPRNPPT
ncbi:hypothetical protein ACWC09_43855 [Streptomyces sp. NPDC001617]